MIYIVWSAKDVKEAKKVIGLLLERRLIACGSIIPGVTSVYRWEGKVEESEEVKVFLKTTKELFGEICNLIHKEGSYEVAEIASISTLAVLPEYEKWLEQEVQH